MLNKIGFASTPIAFNCNYTRIFRIEERIKKFFNILHDIRFHFAIMPLLRAKLNKPPASTTGRTSPSGLKE